MVINDPAALANAVICAVIVCALMFYQRRGARHRPGISILAYFWYWFTPVFLSSLSLVFTYSPTGWWWQTSDIAPCCGLGVTWRVWSIH
jgi:lipopolysaccharide export LptBFGC system permease protein LptF